jgi:hypothetical protein
MKRRNFPYTPERKIFSVDGPVQRLLRPIEEEWLGEKEAEYIEKHGVPMPLSEQVLNLNQMQYAVLLAT